MKQFRMAYLGIVFMVYMLVNMITRLALFAMTGTEAFDGARGLPSLLGTGWLNDLLPFFCLTLPLAALVLLPGARRVGPKTRRALAGLFFVYTVLFLFTAVAEITFWEEFSCRFNFIAVDYLIYTTEVLANIMESYPVLPLVAGIAFTATLLAWLPLRALYARMRPEALSAPARGWICLWLGMTLLTGAFSPLGASENVLKQELAANGVWSLVASFRHNQIDYRQFYPVISDEQALDVLRAELETPDTTFMPAASSNEWQRQVIATGPERRWNVVQIVVESLGVSALGERTPYLNAIAAQSLNFTQLMATGTRTVRGIEALTLSIPPTPGASIVRRPGNEGLFTIGSLFQRQGYDISFIYGGYGYFDNMNVFFESNGFRVVDRATIPDAEKTFANAWGICDEDLLNAALRDADASHAAGKPFYQFVLTTSNHRPFTYPDGKIDVPSGSSRSGAIKYTDYAIGRFLQEAAKKPWFADTVFVIVGDHTAGSAGKTELSSANYHIPCLIYSPGNVQPRTVDTLSSQIDVAPTLFGLLGWSYASPFYGNNILAMPAARGRAWIGTYQLLGRLTSESSGETLVVLEPLQTPRVHARGRENDTQPLITATLAGYQTAQDRFTSGAMRYPGKKDIHLSTVSP